ncbi:MAG: signal recognition particle protein, partial [Gaiellaceae bacterium]
QAVAEDEQALMEERLRKGQFSFEDFLGAYKMIRRMGPLQGVLKMIPGLGKEIKDADIDERQLVRVEAVVLSMTPEERRTPRIIDGKRRRRIAAGSGTSIQHVNQVLEMRRQMERMLKQMGKGTLPGMPSLSGQPRKAKSKRKARSRR